MQSVFEMKVSLFFFLLIFMLDVIPELALVVIVPEKIGRKEGKTYFYIFFRSIYFNSRIARKYLAV